MNAPQKSIDAINYVVSDHVLCDFVRGEPLRSTKLDKCVIGAVVDSLLLPVGDGKKSEPK